MEHAPGAAALTVEPSRVRRPARSTRAARPVEHARQEPQQRSLWSPRASDARPARLGQPGPWSTRQEPQQRSPWSPRAAHSARLLAGGSQRRLSLALFPQPHGARAALFLSRWRITAAPFSEASAGARQGRSGAYRGALARVRRPAAQLGQPLPRSTRQGRSSAHLAVEPFRRRAGCERHSRQEFRSVAALRGEEARTRRVYTRQRRGRPSPAGCLGTSNRRHPAAPPLPRGCPLTCSPPHMKG